MLAFITLSSEGTAMRFIALIFACLFSCIAQAQVPMTGAGLGAPSSGGGGFSLTYESDATSTATTVTISYGTVTWGSGCNAVILGIQWYNTTLTDTVSVVTAGANSLSQVSSVAHAVGNGSISVDAWEIVSPVGTSGTVSVTYSAAPTFSSAVAAYCLVSTHTTATAGTGNGTTATSVNQSITVPSGGSALILAGSSNGSTISLTNGTIDVSAVPGGTDMVFGHTTSTGAVSVTATVSTSTALTLGLAAWQP